MINGPIKLTRIEIFLLHLTLNFLFFLCLKSYHFGNTRFCSSSDEIVLLESSQCLHFRVSWQKSAGGCGVLAVRLDLWLPLSICYCRALWWIVMHINLPLLSLIHFVQFCRI